MKKILAIDEDMYILDAISLVLEDNGYIVATLSSGEYVLEKAKEFSPDLIFLDVLMSGIDGRDICKILKKNPQTMHIPVIMITAHPSAGNSIAEFGADGLLEKPFDTDELISKIADFSGSVKK